MKSRHAYPDYNFKKITDITTQDLHKMGARAIAVDLDNTTVKDASMHISTYVKEWISMVQEAGYYVIIITNTFSIRAQRIAKKMGGVPFIAFARKPHTFALKKAAKKLAVPINTIAMVGDQLFTDIFSANKAGAISIKVEPIEKEKLFAKHWKKIRRKEIAYLKGEEVDIEGLEQSKEMNFLYKWRMDRIARAEARKDQPKSLNKSFGKSRKNSSQK